MQPDIRQESVSADSTYYSAPAWGPRKIPYRTRVYSCRVCMEEFEGYFVGRHWYCSKCRRLVVEAKAAASSWVSMAIRFGVLMPASMFRCDDCAEWATGWEHRDYSKPLEVDPTCGSCNLLRGPAVISSSFSSYSQEQLARSRARSASLAAQVM